MSEERTLDVVDDEEYAQLINTIIRRDYFPYQSTLRSSNAVLGQLNKSRETISEQRLQHILQSTPNENSEVQALPSLQSFVDSTASRDESSFQALLEADQRRRRLKHWWLEDSPEEYLRKLTGEGWKLIKSSEASEETTVSLIDPKGKTHLMRSSGKNGLMFYPEAIKGDVNEKKGVVERHNTRFRRPENLRETKEDFEEPLNSGAVNGFDFVPSTPLIEPTPGNVSPLVTWGSVAETPVCLEEAESRSFRMFEVPKKDKVRMSLAKKMGRARRKMETPRSQTPKGEIATPSRSWAGFSPAAKRLAARSKILTDSALRRSYGDTPLRQKTPTPRDYTPLSSVSRYEMAAPCFNYNK